MGESASDQKTLVAGAGGFTGDDLVRELLDRGEDVWAAGIKSVERWEQVHDGIESLTLDLCLRGTYAWVATQVERSGSKPAGVLS